MKLYGKRFLKSSMESTSRDRKETRDAIVWEINEVERYCRVKVAASDALIRAWFPVNIDRVPTWLRVGTPVRIHHVSGERSRIEVTGLGLVLPSSAAGAQLPIVPIGSNGTMTFMNMNAQFPEPGENLTIAAGTYRINGVIYLFTPETTMAEGGTWYMGQGGDMGGDYLLLSVDPVEGNPGEYWFRYDVFVVGEDGEVDYIKGDPWRYISYTGNLDGPQVPDIPAEHIIIGRPILRIIGQDVVQQRDIGRVWEIPVATELRLSRADDPAGSELGGRAVPYNSIYFFNRQDDYPPLWWRNEYTMCWEETVEVYDQYGNPAWWSATGQMNVLKFSYFENENIIPATGWTDILGVGYMGSGDIVYGESVDILLYGGWQKTFRVWREHHWVPITDVYDPLYNGYWQGEDWDIMAMLQIQLISNGNRGIIAGVPVIFADASTEEAPE